MATDTTAASSRPAWVLLNARAFVGDKPNATTAKDFTRKQQPIEVSFWPAQPPFPSELFVHCPDLGPSAFTEIPRILRVVDDLLLLRVAIGCRKRYPPPRECDYFIYRADPKRPLLQLLPHPHPILFHDDEVGLLPHGDHYTVAALVCTMTRNVFTLHLLNSKIGKWRSKEISVEAPQRDFPIKLPKNAYTLRYHQTSTVITLGGEGGTMGWVDLWRGILLCDVLHPNPALRGVPLPFPMREINYYQERGLEFGCPKPQRGIAFIKRGNEGFLKFVSLEQHGKRLPDDDDETGGPSLRVDGWTITTCSNYKMTDSFDDWQDDLKAEASKIDCNNTMHSQLLSGLLQHKPSQDSEAAAEFTLQNLYVSEPTPSMDDKDVVYLMTRVKFQHPKAWVLAVDMKDNALQGVAEFDTQRELGAPVTYCPGSLSKYMNLGDFSR